MNWFFHSTRDSYLFNTKYFTESIGKCKYVLLNSKTKSHLKTNLALGEANPFKHSYVIGNKTLFVIDVSILYIAI